jgi:hypoxanthine phosphoribosyltransferase
MEHSEALRVLEEADCLANQHQVEQAIDRLAGELVQRVGQQMPVVLCVMNGGLIFAGQLLTRLNIPLEVGYVHATRYGDAVRGGRLEWLVPPPRNLDGRTVLLVDDILDEGVTLAAIAETCRELGAASVQTVVLVDKQHDRKVSPGYRADFTGIDIPDRFVFGYGLDYQGFWRNAAGIYAVKGL